MTPIEVKILTGPSKGAKETFTESPVTFGRAPECNIVVPDTVVSRNHGELRFENERWVLANLSPNGTLLGRKNVTKKPRPLQNQDVISVGDMSLFQVSMPTPISEVDDDSGANEAAAPIVQHGLTRKTKVWIGVGIYFFLMILIIIVLSSSGGDDNGQKENSIALTPSQIKMEILDPAEVDLPNAAIGQQRLKDARTYLNNQRADPAAMYKAYAAYKEAMAYLERDTLPDPGEHLKFTALEDVLIEEVVERYERGFAYLEKRAYKEAEHEFRALKRFYSDTQSTIYRDIEKKQAYALRNMKN